MDNLIDLGPKCEIPSLLTSSAMSFRLGEKLLAAQQLDFRLLEQSEEASGEGGGVSDGLLGEPLNVMSISTNSRSWRVKRLHRSGVNRSIVQYFNSLETYRQTRQPYDDAQEIEITTISVFKLIIIDHLLSMKLLVSVL